MTNGGGSSPPAGETEADKKSTFRQRRLSVAQDSNPDTRNRRLSVYGGMSEDDKVPSVVTSPITTCGCKTVGGLEPVPGGTSAKINQDRGLALWPYRGVEDDGLWGVYDGHGRIGQEVSEYVLQNLPGVVADKMENSDDIGQILKEAYVNVDTTLADNIDASVSGTTAVTCFMRKNHLWLANSGDSRAIIVRKKKGQAGFKSIDLTEDQKPDTPAEMRRILQMGGHVTPAGANGSPSRVWHNLRGLAMARSIGDHAAATVGVIAEPEITEYDVHEDDHCLIIASDGVWELITSEQVADIVYRVTQEADDVQKMCDAIVEQVRGQPDCCAAAVPLCVDCARAWEGPVAVYSCSREGTLLPTRLQRETAIVHNLPQLTVWLARMAVVVRVESGGGRLPRRHHGGSGAISLAERRGAMRGRNVAGFHVTPDPTWLDPERPAHGAVVIRP